MKILLIMDPGIAVPPPLYGGHERLVYMFAEEYQKMGHTVHLLAGPGSKISGTAHSFGINDLKRSKFQKIKELLFAWKFLYKKRKDFDLIHNFGRLAYLMPILNAPVKKIMTYGRTVDAKNIYGINKFANQNLRFTAPSYDCVASAKSIGHWTRVYNAIDFSKYKLAKNVGPDAPLIFLSRLDRVKGCHIAIQVAKATNQKLIIAGNISALESEKEYFDKEIKPFIDNEQISYVGVVNDEQKNEYLGTAKAMLFPINVREAFGMVMAEAMACGTPVIAFNAGATPEVIINSVNGYVVNNKDEMIQTLDQVKLIDRSHCRENAESRFDVTVIANEYLTLFDHN
ncbi:glycosyltransferase [Pedobacter jeongneungensis]|uniref:glycosyltransferase n=1 Tax=Pedobacter jeongneungensis TaxID=947309 RepID=UPI00046848D8|nr:glycosyltransferase [Pedobacter jeongneungensis]